MITKFIHLLRPSVPTFRNQGKTKQIFTAIRVWVGLGGSSGGLLESFLYIQTKCIFKYLVLNGYILIVPLIIFCSFEYFIKT